MINQKLIFVFLFTSITNTSALFYFLKDYGHQHSHEEVDHHNYHPHHHHDEHKHHEHKHHDQKHQNHKYQAQDHKQQEYKYHEHKYPQEQQQMHKHHEYDYHYYHHPHGYEQQKHHQNHKNHEDHKTHDEHKQHTNHKSHEDHKHHEEHKHHAMKPNKHDHKNHEHKQHEYDHKHHEHKQHEYDHKHHEHKHHEYDHKHHEHKHHEHDHKHHEHKHHEYDHKHHEHKHHEHDHKHSYHDHKYHEHKHPEHYQHHSHQGQPHYEFKYGVRDPSTGDIKNQWEVRKGDDVQGEYSLVEADGTIRTVQYKAGKHTGFNAIVKKEGKAKHPATGESRGHSNFVPQKQPDRGLKPPQQEPVRDVYEFKPKTGDIFAEGDTARLHYFSAPEIPANHKPIFTGIDEETNLLALYKNYPVYNMHGQEEHGFDYGIREYLSKRSYDLSKITELLNENSSSPSVNPLKAVRGRFVMGR